MGNAAMTRTSAKVGAAEVFATGSIIAPQNTPITLFPFDDQPEYTVVINFEVSEEFDKVSEIYGESSNIYEIFWRLKWRDSIPLVNIGLEIASSDEAVFKMNTVLQLVGIPSRYAIDFSYTLLKEAK